MWLVRLLILVLVLAALPLIVRIVTGFVAALLGRPAGPARPRSQCPRCNDTGWVATGEAIKKACECGAVPPDARGPVIELGQKDRR